jgi:Spy/CpxP family protein refolding chaperone
VKLAVRYVSFASFVILAGLVVAWGQGTPSTQPSSGGGAKDAKPAHTRGLVAPWNKLSLTDEQKNKIIDIHMKANAERKVIDDREEADIMALLNDTQKAELEKMNAEKKAQAAEKRKAAKDEKDKEKEKGGD